MNDDDIISSKQTDLAIPTLFTNSFGTFQLPLVDVLIFLTGIWRRVGDSNYSITTSRTRAKQRYKA
jgi:hypothetical protein